MGTASPPSRSKLAGARPSDPPRAPKTAGPSPLVVVAVLTVAAAALRFGTLGTQSLWLDESATVSLVRRGFGDMLSGLPSSESTPPLYYVLAWAWTQVFGSGAEGLRSLSALAGTATVPVAYLAARGASQRAGLWAAAIAATSPLTFYYAQEGRAYALLILISGLAFWLWQRALARPDRARAAAWAGVSAIALLTHYFAAFLIVPQALWLLRRAGWRALWPAFAGLSVVGLALVPLALRQRADGKSDWIQDTPLMSRLAQAPKQFLVGIDGPAETASALVAASLVIVALGWLLRRRGEPIELRCALRAATIVGAALALPLALSLSGAIDVFNGRNIVAAWVPACAVMGAAFGASRVGGLAGLGLCAVGLVVIAGVLGEPAYQRDNWKGVASAVDGAAPGAYLVLPANGRAPLSLYVDELGPRIRGGTFVARELDVVSLRTGRSGRAPLPPATPPRAPRGFTPAGERRTSAWAVARFVARRPVRVPLAELAKLTGDPDTETSARRAR